MHGENLRRTLVHAVASWLDPVRERELRARAKLPLLSQADTGRRPRLLAVVVRAL